jgi:hypothetical protein
MNKFIFEVKLLGSSSVEIDILHWDPRFIYDSNNFRKHPFCVFRASNGYSVCSLGSGGMSGKTLEIPEYQYLYSNDTFIGKKIRHVFNSDLDRRNFLKGIYICLTEWSVYYEEFKKDKIDTSKIMLNGNFWIK